ncbi:hypothetical protein MCGE09_00167 [Thaumarchaeota archaeon SCGC AB-539-E09]|nr:hypothetical protein MCGE09_00167 [Thaumarchaeota archaeon SCGC AB-539-E09]
MSYDPLYREWVERLTNKKEAEGLSESNELYQVYRGVPVFRVKVRDDPPQYRFLAPVVSGRTRDFNRISKKIDQRLDKTQSTRVREKAPRKDEAIQFSNEVTYFQKWQNCQMELEDMKRRETSLASKLDEFQAKMDELSSARTQLRKQVTDLKKQLEASEAIISDLNKKIA